MPEAARGRKARADRKPSAQALGQRHDVRRHPGPLVGEQPAGTPHPALHLVQDQQEIVLVAQLAQLLEEARRRGADAALALDRLDQNGGGLLADRILDLVDLAQRHRIEAGQAGPESSRYLSWPPAEMVASVRPKGART